MSANKTKNQKTSIDELSYEQAFEGLEEIVALLENEKHTLDESLNLFERGQELAKRCTALLEQAELKVQQLSDDGLLPFDN